MPRKTLSPSQIYRQDLPDFNKEDE